MKLKIRKIEKRRINDVSFVSSKAGNKGSKKKDTPSNETDVVANSKKVLVKSNNDQECISSSTKVSVDNLEFQNYYSENIDIINFKYLDRFKYCNANGVAVIMPCIDVQAGIRCAKQLLSRAGMKCKIIIVVDTLAHGFIKVLNKTARRVCVKYVVFVAQDAIAGMNWLKMAYQDLERTGKGLLAFNDGKWQGVIASFGMVRVSWSYKLYGNSILYPGYRSHCADDELTFISRARNQWVYNPNILLVEVDYNKGMRGGGNKVDRTLFFQRMATGFEQKVNYSEIRRLSSEYNAIIKNMSNGSSVRKGDKLKKKKTSIAFKGHKPLPRPVVNPKKMIMLVSGASGSGKTNFSQRVFHDQLLFISLDQLTVDSSHEIKPILEKMDEIMKSLSKNSIEETFKKGMRRVNLLIPTVINYRKTFIQYLITIIRQSKSEFIVIDSIYFEYPEFHSEFMDQCENEFIIWNTTRII